MELKKIIKITLISLLLIIMIQNFQSVTFKILFGNITMPHALLLLLIFLAGFFTGNRTQAITASKIEDSIKKISKEEPKKTKEPAKKA